MEVDSNRDGRGKASAGGGGPAEWLMHLKTAMFGSLHVIQKKITPHSWATILGAVVRFCQMMVFVFAKESGFRWVQSTVGPVATAVGLTTVHGWAAFYTPQSYLGLFYFSLAYVAIFILLFMWAMWSFANNSFRYLWPLKLLRSIGSFSATVLFIPMFSVLMAAFRCVPSGTMIYVNYHGGGEPEAHVDPASYWSDHGLTCYQGAHLAQIVINAIFATAFVALCSLFSLVFYDFHPLSVNLAAKAHGRVDFFFLLMKVTLVIMIEVYPSVVPNTWILIGLVILSGIVWVALYSYMLPHIHHAMNQLHAGLAAMYLWFGVCLALSHGVEGFDAGIAAFLAAPMAATVGVSLANYRAKRLARCPTQMLTNAYEVELKARYLLHEALWGHPTERVNGAGRMSSKRKAGKVDSDGIDVVADDGKSTRDSDKGSVAGSAAGHEGGDNVADPLAGELSLDLQEDVDSRTDIARQMMPKTVLKTIEQLYRWGAARFRGSSSLHVFVARFYAIFKSNRHMQMSHVMQAERRSPPLDVAFAVFQARRSAEDNASSQNQMSALNRVAFEKYLTEARGSMLAAINGQLNFWSELLDARPDMSRLQNVSAELNRHVTLAEKCFGQLLHLNAQSLLVLRLYAEFNLLCMNDAEKAGMLVAEAERIEEQQSRDHARESGQTFRFLEQSSLDVMSDNVGMITIGGSGGNLGIILSCNSFICKMFGYTRWQLERRNISLLVPSPMAESHDLYLKRYLATGNGRVVDYTRSVFGVHRAGHIFPMLLNVRETPASEGPPAFVGVARALNTADNFMILYQNNGGTDYVITGACMASLMLLDLEATSLKSGEVQLRDWVPELPAVWEGMKAPGGTTLCFDRARAQRQQIARQLGQSDGPLSSSGVIEDLAALANSGKKEAAKNNNGNGNGNTAITIGGGDVSNAFSANTDEPRSWVVAHVLEVTLHNMKCAMLSWQHMSTDRLTVAKAEARRAEALARLGLAMKEKEAAAARDGKAAYAAAIAGKQNAQASMQGGMPPANNNNGGGTAPAASVAMPSGHPALPGGAASAAAVGLGCPFMMPGPGAGLSAGLGAGAGAGGNRGTTAGYGTTMTPPQQLNGAADADAALFGAVNTSASGATGSGGAYPGRVSRQPVSRGHSRGASHGPSPLRMSRMAEGDGSEAESGAGSTGGTLSQRLRVLRQKGAEERAAALTPTSAARARAAAVAAAAATGPTYAVLPGVNADATDPDISAGSSSGDGAPAALHARALSHGSAAADAGEGGADSRMLPSHNSPVQSSDDEAANSPKKRAMKRKNSVRRKDAAKEKEKEAAAAAAAAAGPRSAVRGRRGSKTEEGSGRPKENRRVQVPGHSDDEKDAKQLENVTSSALLIGPDGGTGDGDGDEEEGGVRGGQRRSMKEHESGYNGFGGNKSVGDRGSHASSRRSVGRKMQSKLRRVVFDKQQPLLRGLQWLWSTGVLIIVSAIGLAVAIAFVNDLQFSSFKQGTFAWSEALYETELADGSAASLASQAVAASSGMGASSWRSSADRLKAVTRDLAGTKYMAMVSAAGRLMQDTVHIGEIATGMWAYTCGHVEVSEEVMATERAELNSWAADMLDYNARLRDGLKFMRDSTVYELYAGPHVTVNRFQQRPGSLPTSASAEVTLYQAGVEVVSAARFMAGAPLEPRDDPSSPNYASMCYHPSLLFLLNNTLADSDVHIRLNETNYALLESTVTSSELVALIAMGSFAGMSGFLAAVALLVVLPIAWTVERTKEHIIMHFLSLPTSILNMLRAQAERHAKELQDDDDEDEDEGDDGEMSVGGGDMGGNGLDGASMMDDGDPDWDALVNQSALGNGGAPKGKRGSVSSMPTVQSRMVMGGGSGSGMMGGGGGDGAGGSYRDLSRRPSQPGTSKTSSVTRNSRQVAPMDTRGATALLAAGVKAAADKQIRRSNRPLVALLFIFTTPLLALMALFSGVFLVSSNVLDGTITSTAVTLVCNTRSSLVRDVASATRRALTVTHDPYDSAVAIESSRSIADSLEYTERLLTFGTVSVPILQRVSSVGLANTPGVGPDEKQQLGSVATGSICPFAEQYAPEYYNDTQCTTLRGGVLTQGMHASVSEFLSLARFLLEEREHTPLSVPLSTVLTGPGVEDLLDISTRYLIPAMEATCQLAKDGGARSVDEFLRFQTVFLSTFLTMFGMFMVVLYFPRVHRLNNNIQKQRALLLLLPTQVVQASESLKTLIAQILAESLTGAKH